MQLKKNTKIVEVGYLPPGWEGVAQSIPETLERTLAPIRLKVNVT